MYDDDALDDENEFVNILKKHTLDAMEPVAGAYLLCAETVDLLQEISSPAAQQKWSIFRTRRHLRMAIDMLIDAERLALMPI